ncbi:Uncharacterised protein [Amycolatopsis camponoti]|uniref:Uncharacterized protein n=1 Tax=Amycolatopsis camponoti TaxID=2606593 RepID=A0A6I8M0H3_9PSEU|nr:Uncharacterised protein [Amycolatopsis camponoti]
MLDDPAVADADHVHAGHGVAAAGRELRSRARVAVDRKLAVGDVLLDPHADVAKVREELAAEHGLPLRAPGVDAVVVAARAAAVVDHLRVDVAQAFGEALRGERRQRDQAAVDLGGIHAHSSSGEFPG